MSRCVSQSPHEASVEGKVLARLRIDDDGADVRVLSRWAHVPTGEARRVADDLTRNGVLVKVSGKFGVKYALKSVAGRVAGCTIGHERVQVLLAYAEDCIRRARIETAAQPGTVTSDDD